MIKPAPQTGGGLAGDQDRDRSDLDRGGWGAGRGGRFEGGDNRGDDGGWREDEDGPRRPSKRTTVINAVCKFYLRNDCRRGNDCPYIHPVNAQHQ